MNKLPLATFVSAGFITLLTLGAGCGSTPEPVSYNPPVKPIEQPTMPVQPTEPTAPVVNEPTLPPPSVETSTPVTPNTSTPSTPVTTTTIPATTSTSPTAKEYSLTVSQWGIKMVLSKDIADMSYVLKRDAASGNVTAYFTTKSLMTKGGAACDEAAGPLGALTQAKKLESNGPMAAPTNAVKVGDFYYYYSGPQSTCSTDTAVQNMVNAQVKSVELAATKIVSTK